MGQQSLLIQSSQLSTVKLGQKGQRPLLHLVILPGVGFKYRPDEICRHIGPAAELAGTNGKLLAVRNKPGIDPAAVELRQDVFPIHGGVPFRGPPPCQNA